MIDEQEKNIQFILDMMIFKLEHLFNAKESADKKAGFVITIVPAILGSNLILNQDLIGINIFSFGLLLLFVSLGLLLFTLYAIKWSYPPHEDVLYSTESLNTKNIDLKNQIISDIKQSFTDNHDAHERKISLYNWSIFLLISGLLIMFIQLFYNNLHVI